MNNKPDGVITELLPLAEGEELCLLFLFFSQLLTYLSSHLIDSIVDILNNVKKGQMKHLREVNAAEEL